MKSFLSVAGGEVFTSEILINKSRFLCFVKHVFTAAEAEDFIVSKRSKYKDARHICFAYRLQNSGKLSDDGEPAGTAGKPIMEVLEKQGLCCVVAVVVRYFGGIKLGAGGLLRAYTSAVTECLKSAKKVIWESSKLYEKTMDYKTFESFLNGIKGRKIKLLSTRFDIEITVRFVAASTESIQDAVFLGDTKFAFE